MAIKRIEVFYSGLVQGVGFRFTVERLASNLKLKGFTKNLSDGRVEVVVEGKEEDLKHFLDGLKKHFEGYIRNTEIMWFEPTNEFTEFTIKF